MSDPMQQNRDAAGPAWPRCGVSCIVFRGAEVLLVERAKGALKGRWAPPGGHIEPGEPVRAAALREVLEETGVEAEIGGLVDLHEMLLRDGTGALTAHYVLAVFWGRWLSGEPVAASDAVAARFVAVGDVEAYPLTDGSAGLIRMAWRRFETGGG